MIKLAWRDRHKSISCLWQSCQDAAHSAMSRPGVWFPAGQHLSFTRLSVPDTENNYLLMRLPSNRFVVYFDPKITQQGLSYMGVDSLTRKWERLSAYGGKFVENACQSLARDIMAYNMPVIEKQGYRIVLSVHDELITQTSDTVEYSPKCLSALMARVPHYAKGLPLAADGFQSYRYKKD